MVEKLFQKEFSPPRAKEPGSPSVDLLQGKGGNSIYEKIISIRSSKNLLPSSIKWEPLFNSELVIQKVFIKSACIIIIIIIIIIIFAFS